MIACNENRNSVNNSVLLNWAGIIYEVWKGKKHFFVGSNMLQKMAT